MDKFRIKYIAKKLNKNKNINYSNIKKNILFSFFFFEFCIFLVAFASSFVFFLLFESNDFNLFHISLLSLCFSLIVLLVSLYNLEEEVLVKRNKNNILKNLHSQIIFLNLLESEKKESYIQFLISVYNFKKSSFNYLFFDKKEQDFLFKDYEDLYVFREHLDKNGVSFLKDRLFIRSDIEEYHKIQKDKKNLIMKEKELLAKIKANNVENLHDFETNKENEFEQKVKKPESKIINL